MVPVRPEILARSRRFCAQSIRSVRNTCLSTKEHQNPSSITVTSFAAVRVLGDFWTSIFEPIDRFSKDLLRFSYVKPKKEIGEKIFSKSVPISFYITWRCPPRLPASLRDSCEPSRAWHLLPRLRCSAALSLPLPALLPTSWGKSTLEQNK